MATCKKIKHFSWLLIVENHQSDHSMEHEKSVSKMQRILDKLRNEIVDKQHASKGVTLMRESQLRLMNYKELYLHREEIGEEELTTLYANMSVTEREIADGGLATLTFVIEALDELC